MGEALTLASRRAAFSDLLSAAREPQIVLRAVAGLRWLAVLGQIAATMVAVWGLHLQLPAFPIALAIIVTAASNVLIELAIRLRFASTALIPAVVMLDVLILTEILYFAGGPENPFAVLYLVNVAMSVIILRRGWTWAVVAMVAACYGYILIWRWPLERHAPTPLWLQLIGSWLALVGVSVVIVAFIGWMLGALRQREEELNQMRERALRNEQLATLTTLAAGAAHELGTPLGTIAVVAKELEISAAKLAMEPTGPAEQVMREDAALIRQEVDRCRHILSRMRFDIGEEASRRALVDVRELGQRLAENFSDPQRQRLEMRYEPGVVVVRAPPIALEQALLVLLRNAFDASPANVPVVMEVTRQEGHVRFEVQDQGSGMSLEMLRRAGEPFFTTKEPGKGMGLGLFLVRLIAERSGARFSIDSVAGRGTRVRFELPEKEIA